MHTIRIYNLDLPEGKRLIGTFVGLDAEKNASKAYPENSQFIWLR